MKAIELSQYGPPEVLQLKEVDKPVPKDKEVLIRVHATTVNYGDLLARNFKAVTPQKFNMPGLFWFFGKLYFGFNKPNVTRLGSEFSGVVESAGKDVQGFKPGDPVFGYLGQAMGAYAEYLCMPESGVLASKPANMSHEEAAASAYGSIMALHLLREAGIQKGQKVLINGASGSIGAAAVQVAKHFGAEVTAVCGPAGQDYVKALGADKAIDYRREDFTQGGAIYDFVLDVLGRVSFSSCKKVLAENGRLQYVSFKMKQLLQMLTTSIAGKKKVVCKLAPGSVEDLKAVKELIEAGEIKAIIDKSFPMEQAAAAHRYAEEEGSKGPVVIQMFK
ncbi:MAG: NAD(P)-dependent alcohol dehydrogenase [Phaeodactylibacter sp.]|nr:NAD(P)-dependent alcohol dehydrogenase [Phaeodactylibacter sp.]